MPESTSPVLKMIIPKGRLQDKVLELLASVGLHFTFSHRSYRPKCSDPSVQVKLVKAQNIPSLIALGRHDVGFTGLDWLLEHRGITNLPEAQYPTTLLDLDVNPVRIVAAVPDALAKDGAYKKKHLVIASEYEVLTREFIQREGFDATYMKTYGATEALPPEDADMIVDNTATGETLVQNRLTIVDELLRSTTRFIAGQDALTDPWKKEKLEHWVLLMQSTLNAKQRVLLEMNVSKDSMDAVLSQLPSLKSPTVTPLYNNGNGDDGFAVKAAVEKKQVITLIPALKQAGATDILEYKLEKLVP